MPLQIRRGTDAQRNAMTQPLSAGELLWITDQQRLYIGNGSTLPSSLVSVTGYTDENAQDAAASLLTSGTHTGITFTYGTTQDGANRIDASVDLSAFTGPIVADSVKGSVFADDSTLLIDGSTGRIVGPVFSNVTGNLTGNVTGNVTGDVTGNVTGVVTGSLVGGSTGYHTGDVKGSVFADDSTLLIDAVAGRIVGPVFANVTGNLTGNVTGNADTATLASTLSVDGTANINASHYLVFTSTLTGAATALTDTQLLFNASTNVLTVPSVVGNLTGNVTGNLTGNSVGVHTGEVVGSVFADDSTLLIDGTNAKIVGPVDSTSVTGNIYGRYVEISGVSTTDPSTKAGIRIITDGNSDDIYDLFSIEGHKSDNNGMSVVYKRSRGTPAAQTPLQDGDEILGQFWFGADSNADQQIAAAVLVSVEGTPTAGVVPGYMTIATANSSGTITPALTIDSSQTIGVAGGTNLLVAGGSAGQVNTGSVTGYLKINIAGVDRAIPYYSIN